MDHTLFCVLQLFLISTLFCCGHTQDAELTLEPNSSHLFVGECVIFTCGMKGGSGKDWLYEFSRNGQPVVAINTNNSYSLNLTADLSGDYWCVGHHKGSARSTNQSNTITLSVSAHKPTAAVTAERGTIPDGGTVKLSCSVEDSAEWKYDWFKQHPGSNKAAVKMDAAQNFINISSEGIYWCRGRRGNPVYFTKQSEGYYIEKNLPNSVAVTLRHNWTEIFKGETISISCEIQGGANTGWEYEWRTTSSDMTSTKREFKITAHVSYSGEYWCKGRRDLFSSTEWSNAFTLQVSYKPRPRLTSDKRIIPVGGNATLTCSVTNPAQWNYYWFQHTSNFSEIPVNGYGKPDNVISVSQGGIYSCRGGRGNPVFYTEGSGVVTIEKRVSNRAVVSLQPNNPVIFTGEMITVTCTVEGGNAGWVYGWSKPNSDTVSTHDGFRIVNASASSGGNYRCMGTHKQDLHSSTEWSDVVTVIVLEHRPKAFISASSTVLPVGGSVTLTCSVKPSSSGWKYFWYRAKDTSETLPGQEVDSSSDGEITVSQEGLYWCRGGRGDQMYFTENSVSVNINKMVTNRPVVTLQPNWPTIYYGETITLRCEIQGGHTDWVYEWMTTSFHLPPNQAEHRITFYYSHSGSYWCKGRKKNAPQIATSWSASLKLPRDYYKPRPVLSASPSWLSPGSSVTLRCEIEHASAGWRFYWYKAAPDLLHKNYNYDLLPGSTAGTDHDSYIIHGQTHTAGYVCRAGRGDPEYHTNYSEIKFVWSADVHPAASLTVNPDRVQHFTSDSVSLNCGGNSAEWRVMRFTETHHLSRCSSWGRMTGSSCNMNMNWYHSGVYWCESGSGEFSNTVNITVQNDDDGVILVSPVHPVTEGASVSLSCRLREQNTLSSVSFYHNDKLLQHDGREELNISAVSQSDEGFYKCQHAGKTSQQSWMSVTAVSRPESSSFPVLLMVGSVIGIILLIFLLLLCLCKRSKDLCCIRWIQSQSSSQSSSSHPGVNQNETNQYSSPLHDADESRDVTYSPIELKHFGKKRRHHEPEESCVYSEVKTGTAESTPVYAEINHENKGKGKRKNKKSTPVYAEINHENKGKGKKKNKRKWSPAAGDAAVYSEVGLGAALDNNAAM
ncbi:Fc receptor-like protein 5 isoform X1 [Melanotaenia boesemani]|uniref:Fc receptor-like protein 5 isoform X1 n=1 Tax=Melanotaenia boesemani TaxID=1250792 RepID=UPI001C03FAAB|nr:Fc receptor-like protein 5 isoform X1 [Melanotaenia boesemani]